MSYYDKISKQWHSITGYHGGAFKKHVLNNKVLSYINNIQNKTILELGAGNGYFFKLLLKKLSSQKAGKIIISDVSVKQIETAKKHFFIPDAGYLQIDLYKKIPLPDNFIDIIYSIMVFNEINNKGLLNGLKESKRILKKEGVIITAVLHPDFIDKQIHNGVIKNNKMISQKGIKIPVIKRSFEKYKQVFNDLNLIFKAEEVFGNEAFYKEKSVLKKISKVPVALIIESRIK